MLFATWGLVGEVMLGLKRLPLDSKLTHWHLPVWHEREWVRACCKDEWLARGWTCYVATCSAGHASRTAPARPGGGAKPAAAAASVFPGYKHFGPDDESKLPSMFNRPIQ